ncbi:MAG: hypothetical protein KGZ81_07440 [Flavobacteriales bacterium]|nr:hypothetical protein [Flavobacteriales bacterium]
MALLPTQNIERVYLPSTLKEEKEEDKAWVEIKTQYLAAEALDVALAELNNEPSHRNFAVIASLITDWGLEELNEAGERVPVEVNAANVARLKAEDFAFLSMLIKQNEIKNLQSVVTDGQKKTSSDTTPKTPVTEQEI